MSNYFDLQNAPVLTTPSALTAPKITSIGYPGDDTAADPAGGQTITLTGEGFEAGASVIVNNAAVGVVSVVSSTSITFTSPALSTGSYPVYVVNTDGGTAIAVPGIQYSGTPTWTTAAGSLGSYTETQAISNTVTATGDSPISYSLFSGTLPTGATLNSANGLISGTSPLSASPTTYTFTIRATDAQQQDTNRQFSLTINPDVVTWSSPANGTTYTSFANSAISNVALSATAASGQSVSYTANALPTGLSLSGSNITGTPTVVANSSTLLTATAATTNATATRTINWVISVAGDPDFEYVATLLSASNPTSTFVTDASTNNVAVSVFGDTRPNNFGPYTPGYYSVAMNGGNSGDLLSFPSSSTAYNLSGGTWTVEMWMYPTMSTFSDGDCRILMAGSNGTNSAWQLFINSSRLIGFGLPLGGTTSVFTSNSAFSFNTWTHVAVVCQAGSAIIYVNGVSAGGPTSITLPASASVGFKIGYDNVGTVSTQFAGFITNVRINTTTAIYTAAFTPPTAPLTAVSGTSLLTCQSNRYLDTSTNALSVTVAGSPRISGFDPFAPLSTYSTYGSGYFDGTGDYLSVPDNAALDFGSSDFTMECWFYPTATPNNNIFAKRANSATFGGVSIYFSNSLTPGALATTSGSNWEVNFASSVGCVLNSWNHIAYTRSGNTWRLFVNGNLGGSATVSGTIPDNSAALSIGAGAADGSFPISSSYISDVRIIKGTAVYTTAFTPPAAPLTAIANTQLLTLQNNQPNNNNMFLDSSASNFLITRNGNTTQGSFSPYGGGWSNYTGGAAGGASRVDVAGTSGIFGTNISYTIEGWFNFTANSAGDNTNIITYNTNTFPSRWLIDAAVGGGNITLRIVTESNGTLFNGTAVPYTLGTWVHLAIVNNNAANTFTFYINGVAAGSTTKISLSAVATLNLLCNSGSVSSASPFYVSNFRIVNNTAVYTSNFTPSTSPLTAIPGTALLTFQSNRFVDNSAGNLTLTPNGTNQIQRFNPFNPVLTTPTSYSGYFDGNGDSLSYTGGSSLAFGTSDFTIELWAYMANTGTFSAFLRPDDTGTFPEFGYDWSATQLKFDARNAAIVAVTTTAVVANAWNHIAVSRSGTSLRLFVNGSQVGSTTTNSTNFGTTTGTIRIGGSGFSASHSVNGYISNFRVVNGTAVYTSNFTPSTTPLTAIANTSLLTLQNATFTDNSTNNFTITANGNSVPRQFNPFGWTSTTGSAAAYSVANYGGGMYFDGSGDYLTIPNSTVFNVVGNFTLECWVYNTSVIVSGEWHIFGKRASNLVYSWLIFGVASSSSTNRVFIIGSTNGSSWNIPGTTGSIVLPINQWNHIAIVRNGTTMQAYVNGVPDTSLTFTVSGSFFTNSDAVTIATSATSPPNFFPGYISNFRWINGTAVYTSNFAPPVAPLSFNANAVLQVNGTSAAIYDSAMIATYETVGNSSSTTVIKKYGNSSMSFDGTGDYLVSPFSVNNNLGTRSFTFEVWLYPSSIAGIRGFYALTGGSGGVPKFVIHLNAGTPSIHYNGLTGGSDIYTTATSAITANTWTHLAFVRNGSTWTWYINGVASGTGSNSTNITFTTQPLYVGYGGESYFTEFNGYIDDLRVTNGVARYTANFTPPTTPFMQN